MNLLTTPTEDNSDFRGMHINVSVEDATHMYQTGIGAHINQRTLRKYHRKHFRSQYVGSCAWGATGAVGRIARPRSVLANAGNGASVLFSWWVSLRKCKNEVFNQSR